MQASSNHSEKQTIFDFDKEMNVKQPEAGHSIDDYVNSIYHAAMASNLSDPSVATPASPEQPLDVSGSEGRAAAPSHLAQRPKHERQTQSKNKPKQKPQLTKKQRRIRRFRRILVTVLVLASLYCIAVFSNIPFIKKWRDIYIETAMGTMTHQWLATMFIPR